MQTGEFPLIGGSRWSLVFTGDDIKPVDIGSRAAGPQPTVDTRLAPLRSRWSLVFTGDDIKPVDIGYRSNDRAADNQ